MLRSTSDIKRQAPAALLAGLLDITSTGASKDAAARLIAQARDHGLDLKSYLRLAIDPRLAEGDAKNQFLVSPNEFMNGYEASLSFLNLPTRDDLESGVMLQAAADTFQTFTGTRALFPEVIDDMVAWRYRQTNFETIDGMISQNRQIAGNEMLSTIVEDTQADYTNGVRAVAEGGRIPIHAIKTSEQRVKLWKFGTGYKTTYEFARRASLDLLTPYAIRVQREIERSKVAAGTSVLLNGDGAYGAAPVVTTTSFNAAAGVTATNGVLNYKSLAAWLVARAQAGTPVDTVLGNWDMYLQWLFLFTTPNANTGQNTSDALSAAGFKIGGIPLIDGTVQFKLSSTMPAAQLLGYSRGDTMEQLTESGSLINESEQSIQTQEVTYVRTENSGFKLTFGDTRSVLNLVV
jgi:hypothetical protein